MRKTHLLTAILAVFTVLLLTWNVSLATSVPNPSPFLSVSPPDFDINEVNPVPIVWYKPTEIARPLTYWTLTEPIDPYIPFAISVGNWIPCRENETTFLQQVEEHNGEWKIEYQGSYYEIEALGAVAPHPTPTRYADGYFTIIHLIGYTTEHAISSILLAGLWAGMLIVWKKKG